MAPVSVNLSSKMLINPSLIAAVYVDIFIVDPGSNVIQIGKFLFITSVV